MAIQFKQISFLYFQAEKAWKGLEEHLKKINNHNNNVANN